MTFHARALATLAALSLLTLAACAATATLSPAAVAVPSPPPVESPAASPSPAAVPSANAGESPFACEGGTTGCAGNLTAGVNSSTNFTIPFTVTVPDGWANIRDITRTYELSTSTGQAGPIEVLALNAIADQASCGPVPLAGAGSTVQDFIDHVSHHPGLDATAPVPVTIDGYQGQSIDFGVRSDWTAMCPDIDPISPVVLLLTSTNTDPPARHLAYSQDVRARWIVLDVAGETVIVEVVGPPTQSLFDTAMAEDQPVIDSLDFSPGG